MTIKATSGLKPDWYTPKCEAESQPPTRFRLAPLDGLQYLEVLSETTTDAASGQMRLTGHGLALAIRYGLKTWQNLVDGNGESVGYSPSAIGRVPPEILAELAEEIINRSSLQEDDRKNS